MPRILGNPGICEEVYTAKSSSLKFGTVENLAEHGEDDGIFEEHENDNTEEVVQNCDCYVEENTLSPQDTAETMGDALQFQNHGDASIPSDAGNTLKRIVDFKSVIDYIMDIDKVETLAFADTVGISEEKTNSVSFGGGNAQECQDPGARNPIGASGIEKISE